MDAPIVEVSLTLATYPATPQLGSSEGPLFDQITIVNTSALAADAVYISFDGVTDHGKLVPTLTQGLTYTQKRRKVFLRLETAPGPVDVIIMAGTNT